MSAFRSSKAEVVIHTDKSGMDLRVVAELKSTYEPSDISDVRRVFDSFCASHKQRNHVKAKFAYSFKELDSNNAELWHLNSKGDPDYLVASISVIKSKEEL